MRIEHIGGDTYRVFIEAGYDYNGKRKRHNKTFHAKTKRDLNKQIKDWEATFDTATTTSSTLTVAQMIDAVWDNIIDGKSRNTIIGYEKSRDRIKRTIGKAKVNSLHPRTIQKWINDLKSEVSDRTGKPLSPKTIKDTYSILNLCCSTAVNWDLLKTNPCHDIILPKKTKEEIRILSPEELQVFCSRLDEVSKDTKVLFEFAIFCGLRRGEIMGIKESDITKKNVIIIERARYKDGDDVYEKTVKTPAGNRMCYLPKFVANDIRRLMNEHKKDKLRLAGLYEGSEYLLHNARGGAFIPNEANSRLTKYMKKIGLEPINFHALRHTYASICIANGNDPATVSSRLGHSDITTTLNIYTHLFKKTDENDKISGEMDELFKKRG